jgi:hypothetical protein
MKKSRLLKQQIAECANALTRDHQQLTQLKAAALQNFQYNTENLYPWLTAATFMAGFACTISPRIRRSLSTAFKYSVTTILNNKFLLESLVAIFTLKINSPELSDKNK